MKERNFNSRAEYEMQYRLDKLYKIALREAEQTYAEFWLFCKANRWDIKTDCKRAWADFIGDDENICASRAIMLYGGSDSFNEINRRALVDYMRAKK